MPSASFLNDSDLMYTVEYPVSEEYEREGEKKKKGGGRKMERE